MLVAVGQQAIALDAASGAERWATDSGFGQSAIAIADRVVYVLDLNDGLAARDLQTGEATWTFDVIGAGFFTNLAVSETRVVAVNARFAYGLDPADGSLSWTLGEDERTRFSVPVIADDVVYFFADDRGLVAHDIDSGAEQLRVDIPEAARQQGPPLPFGDLVVFFDVTGALRAYR